jgi:hypothetical protein
LPCNVSCLFDTHFLPEGHEDVLDFVGTKVVVDDVPYQLVRVHNDKSKSESDLEKRAEDLQKFLFHLDFVG